jgi:hypothetical protein
VDFFDIMRDAGKKILGVVVTEKNSYLGILDFKHDREPSLRTTLRESYFSNSHFVSLNRESIIQ